MKTVLDKLSDKQAKHELDSRTNWLFAAAIVTFFIFWPFAGAVVALGFRNFLLTYHKGSKNREDITKIRVLSGGAVAIALSSLIINLAA